MKRKIAAVCALLLVLAMTVQADARCRRCRGGRCGAAAAPACSTCK
ncbi:MAG TPA: hypothetical protein VGN12_19230 [Pirellulales bacterium]